MYTVSFSPKVVLGHKLAIQKHSSDVIDVEAQIGSLASRHLFFIDIKGAVTIQRTHAIFTDDTPIPRVRTRVRKAILLAIGI